jgi:hypothetical protein
LAHEVSQPRIGRGRQRQTPPPAVEQVLDLKARPVGVAQVAGRPGFAGRARWDDVPDPAVSDLSQALRIAPQPPRAGLTSAAARLETPYGEASVSWMLADGSVTVSATVPVGATADVVLPSGRALTVEHGAHEWAEPFEVDAVERAAVTVDTPMGALIDDAQAIAVFMGVVTKYVPEAAAHMSGGLNGRDEVTPRQIAGMMPHSDAFLADLERGFAAVSAGEAVPEDLFASAGSAPEPDAEPEPGGDDGLLEAAGLLSGQDFWSTRAGDGIRSLVLVDGPHGVRRQGGAADNLGFNESLPATCFPPGVALGSTWNPGLMREVGEALGREARALDVDVLLGPAINIKRSPLGGRTFEYL